MTDGWMAGQRSFEGLTLNLLRNAWFPVQRHASVNGRPAMATLLITVGCCRPLSTKDRRGTLDSSSNYRREYLLPGNADLGFPTRSYLGTLGCLLYKGPKFQEMR